MKLHYHSTWKVITLHYQSMWHVMTLYYQSTWKVMTFHNSQFDRWWHFNISQYDRSWHFTSSECNRSWHFTNSQFDRSWHFTIPLPPVNNIVLPHYRVTVAICEVLTAELFVVTVDCWVGGECDILQHVPTVTHSSQETTVMFLTSICAQNCNIP